MLNKHKELLDQCHQNLLDSITDADRVIELLIVSGTLSQLDRFELDQNCSSSAEKVDHLLKMLMNKESDHFLDLCVALEKAYPDLYTALFGNSGGGPVDHSTGSTYSVLSTMPSDSESSSSLSSVGSPVNGEASSPPPAINDNRPSGDNLDTILFQLRQVTRERDELRKRLALASPGTTFDDCRPNSKASHDYERLKSQCMRAMADLQSLQNQHTKTLKRCEEAVKEADFYHMLHSRVLGEQTQLKEEMETLRRDNAQLVREHNHVKQNCEELKRLHSQDQKELADLRLQQQQVMREKGSSEVLNKLYDTAMEKLDGVKKEYDALSKRYSEKVANHNTDLSRLEQVEEENRRLQKQMDALLKQHDSAMQYQQQYSTSIRRFDSVQQELNKSSAQNKELQREMERLQSEVTRYKNLQLKAAKDCEKYKEERDSVFSEYRLIMSERDQVIKELDKLQTELEAAEARLKNTSSERVVASEELEALRQELNSSLVDRDRAICERNELLEKYCHEVKDKAEAQKELSQACKDIETVREERDVARKERTEAIIQRDQLLREYYQARQKQDSATLDMERANKEIEMLRKQYEAMSQELKEATQEAEVAKCRRDWAFQERDKIVAERESIRTLCDNLRRERDRAVSDLADALRNLDDMRKQKNDALRELKELKEKMESQLEKEARFCQLMAHSSHDSAIDTDSLEWETEVVEFEKDRDDMDLKALGFDIAEGVNDPYLPGDCGIFVTRVDKGSIADGRLRVNDWLLKINDIDLTNKDRKQVVKAVLNGGGLINMVVRRRKSLGGRLVTPVHINLAGHKDCGIGLESGVFVAAIVQGSPAAREGSPTVGDRLIAINGIALDNKSVTECEALLRSCRDSLSLSLMKFFPHSTSGQNIFESLRDSSEKSNGRIHLTEVHSRNSRNLKRNSSTQTDIFCPDVGNTSASSISGERRKVRGESDEVYGDISKPFSPSSLHATSLRPGSDLGIGRYGPSAFQECCTYTKAPSSLPFEPVSPSDCITMETTLEKKHGGGIWPKMMVGGMSVAPDNTSPITAAAQLSIFKSPKQRKSIFDPDTFKRPETPSSKMEYMAASQIAAVAAAASSHSPQPSKTESLSSSSTPTPTPPTPPTRSDSFMFKHKHQSSSASDCTITSDGKGEAVISMAAGESRDRSERERDRNGNHYFLDGKVLTSRKSCDEDIGRTRGEEPEVKRPRPKSAPALRRRMTPQTITLPTFQSYSNDEHSPEPRDMLRSSPSRSHRHSVGFVPTVYNGTLPSNSAHRGLSPCPAVTAVMRNPVYTVRSHRVHTSNCPSVSSQICHQHTHTSPQHQGRLSLDLSQQKRATDYSESSSSRSSRASHGTNSLPSSARLGSANNVQYRTERIKIPSTPRYPRSMLGSDRGSLSHSECSSPSLITPPQSPLNLETSSFASSQSQGSISTLPRISVSPVPIGERRKDRPYLEEPRNVIVHKGAEPLGISIVSGENGGIFVSKVTGGSIAHQAGLEYGDQLLEYNGINLRNATEQQARLIIGQQCDTITIMAQYNPHMYQLGNHSRSSSRLEPVSTQPTPQGSGAATPDNHSTIDTLSEQDEGTLTPSSKQTTPTTSPRNFIRMPSDGSRKVGEPRLVTVHRPGVEVGVTLCGGNLRGVYIESLDEDSPARGPDGLLSGDLILEYNSVNMKNKTAEEVYVEMLKPAETVTFKVHHRPDDFNMLKDVPGDGFYIRALYDRVGEAEGDLSFKKDDILYVDESLPKGSFGTWMAWQLDENAQKIQRGQIPSKYMMDQEFYRRYSVTEIKEDSSKTLSAAARRSFFRRKQKHKRSSSKDSKEMVALDTISTDSIPFFDDCVSLAYQRVQKVECTSPRPVLILGPLTDPVKEMLVKESPGKFCRCLLEVMKASQQAIERGVKDCLFIDYKRRSGHFDVTTVACIKEITDKGCHCLLDIAPHAIERLHSVHIYPIVVFVRYKNAKQIKEQKDSVYLRDKVSQKHSKEQFESAQKIEQEYSKFFTGIVQGGTLPYICTQIMTIVDQEQSKVLWTPLGCP
ncbi:Disks large -like protein 5 Discs large protein P-dlg Placenta and prostate DLG [Channa argus]|uniref:Disks large-like protein 5 Discs large protein P-dlg Placenta and prostate DLG n=1 Tax=Channa argus TaxID=215402 RepID=A0A6G1R069_CHAAH|nr:Disks large -like protein 5 Discs large protein P-dlg Placenta and prostate DLG [Channa argus]